MQRACGYVDAYPVATEPFSEWVVSADSRPVGHAGKKQVPLWSLRRNRSSSASSGSSTGHTRCWPTPAASRGHSTIDEAIADPACRSWVEMFWDEASRHLTLPAAQISPSTGQLLTRFSNPRAGDQLAR